MENQPRLVAGDSTSHGLKSSFFVAYTYWKTRSSLSAFDRIPWGQDSKEKQHVDGCLTYPARDALIGDASK